MRYLDGSAFFNHWLTKLGFLDGWRSIVEPEDEEIIFDRVGSEAQPAGESSRGASSDCPNAVH